MATTTNSSHALMALDDALARVLAFAGVHPADECVHLMAADGRILAEDIVSALQIPPADNSAMDGYAVRSADCTQAGVELPVSQRIPAGAVSQPLQAGSAARIFTGAQIPAGADAVVMQEQTESLEDGARVRIQVPPRAGQFVRRAGEDVARGAAILARGTRLGPAEIGLAASLGRDQARVARRPRVALLSTGDELVLPGSVAPEKLPRGAIFNSSLYFLHVALARLGCTVSDVGIVRDDRAATVAALRQAAADHDVILSSGGVSVGEEDHVKPAVAQLGGLDLWKIAMKPGKPFAFGHLVREDGSRAWFVGLPGNPVSSFVTFLLLVRPFLLKLQGATRLQPTAFAMRADFAIPKANSRREFLRVRLNDHGGLDLFANQSSGVLTSMHWADGLVDNPVGQTIAAGDLVRFLPFSGVLS